jgi:ribosome-interacting GTPase 1
VTITKRKTGGGVRFASTVPQTLLGPEPEKVVTQILREYRIISADVLAREEISVDQLVDVVSGNREYKPCLYMYNKIDTITIEEVDQLARLPHSIVGSVVLNLNIAGPLEDDLVKQKLWEYLGLTRVYTKRKGSPPDLSEPVILSEIRRGTTVKSLCSNISSELLRDFNYSLVWGTSAKHTPQRCGLNHRLDDEDVVQIVSKTVKQQQQDKSYGSLAQQYADKHAKKRLEAKKQKQKRLRG